MDIPVPYAFIVVGALVLFFRLRKKPRFPPGPKGLPIVGNALDLPKAREWLTYAKWSRECGSDIIHLRFFGTHVFVLNSVKVVNELMVKRSAIYSDRGEWPMVKLTGWQRNFTFVDLGDHWKARARMFQQNLGTSTISRHRPKLVEGNRKLLLNLLLSPDDFMKHIRYLSGSSILGIIYGIEVQQDHDPFVETAEKALQCLAAVINAGSYAVNYVPILRFLPTWAPGAQFKRDAAEWYKYVTALIDGPYTYVKKSLANGENNTSIVGTLLQELSDDEKRSEQEDIIREAFGTAYTGGVDTTYSSVNSFILAMLKYPDVQRKAQEELDRVIGRDRLPSFDDRDALPYITAIVKETLRWGLVAPLAAPHQLRVDDEYEGYFLPAGSVIIGNAWVILNDEKRYPHPESFIPERYLTTDGTLDSSAPDPTEACFGFGRRMCLGRYFAFDSLWIAVASLAAAFHMEKAVDESGSVIEPSGEYTSGTACYPLPFKAVFRPRHEGVVALIKADVSESDSL
uniref:Cytochrome P450 n=1 Tax=Phanerodontia chrysosporium TaxID=2822231 RepID=G5EJV9_PHACH|nr:cytochrome P450 [Phanerodontia chrysosporium]